MILCPARAAGSVSFLISVFGGGYILCSANSKKSRTPAVSIGLPVFNGETYLSQALDSLLGQTFPDFELIISDNASTDGTEQICREYQGKDPRIIYHRQSENKGAAANYNYVFQVSRARYFKWAAADDLCGPEMLEQCVTILDSHPDIVLCYPKTSIIDERGHVIRAYDDQWKLSSPEPTERFCSLLRQLQECNAVFGLIRSDVLTRTPLIGNYIHSDSCLLVELSLHGRFHELPERSFYRREHPEASSVDRSIDKQLEFFDPALLNKIVLQQWRRLWESLRSVWRVPIALQSRIALSGQLALFLVRRRRMFLKELVYAGRKLVRRTFLGVAPAGKERVER